MAQQYPRVRLHDASVSLHEEPLLPDRWKLAHPESVLKFREDERRQVDDRKEDRRERRRREKKLSQKTAIGQTASELGIAAGAPPRARQPISNDLLTCHVLACDQRSLLRAAQHAPHQPTNHERPARRRAVTIRTAWETVSPHFSLRDGFGSVQVWSFLAGAAGYQPAPFDLAVNDVLHEAAAQTRVRKLATFARISARQRTGSAKRHVIGGVCAVSPRLPEPHARRLAARLAASGTDTPQIGSIHAHGAVARTPHAKPSMVAIGLAIMRIGRLLYASLGRSADDEESERLAEFGISASEVDAFPRGVIVGRVELYDSDDGEWYLRAPQRAQNYLPPRNRPNPVWFYPFS